MVCLFAVVAGQYVSMWRGFAADNWRDYRSIDSLKLEQTVDRNHRGFLFSIVLCGTVYIYIVHTDNEAAQAYMCVRVYTLVGKRLIYSILCRPFKQLFRARGPFALSRPSIKSLSVLAAGADTIRTASRCVFKEWVLPARSCSNNSTTYSGSSYFLKYCCFRV